MKKIFFKPEMIRAILDGKKTQTRRLVKYKRKSFLNMMYNPQPLPPKYKVGEVIYVQEPYFKDEDGRMFYKANMSSMEADFCRKQFSNAMFMPEKHSRIKLKIIAVRKQCLNEMCCAEFVAEGFKDIVDFWKYFQKLNPGIRGDEEVWAYTFEVVKK